MCWKQEWAMAIHNLALAEIHIGRAEAKLQKRLERSKHWLEKWSKSGHAGPKGIAEIKVIIERNQKSLNECREIMTSLILLRNHKIAGSNPAPSTNFLLFCCLAL
jgi:hypothetical protein